MVVTRSQAARRPVARPAKIGPKGPNRPIRKIRRRARTLHNERLQLVLPDQRILTVPDDMVDSFKRLCVLMLDMPEHKQRHIYHRFSSQGHVDIMEHMVNYMKVSKLPARKIDLLVANWSIERHRMVVYYHGINAAAG